MIFVRGRVGIFVCTVVLREIPILEFPVEKTGSSLFSELESIIGIAVWVGTPVIRLSDAAWVV
jgi:hypothetical protein